MAIRPTCEEVNCACSDDFASCECVANETGDCTNCRAPLVLVDTETGKTVAPPVDPRQGGLFG